MVDQADSGMVFQNPDNQLVATTVEDDVAFGPENLGVPPDEIAERVRAACQQLGWKGLSCVHRVGCPAGRSREWL